MTRIEQVVVAVPARDEEARLPAALAAIRVAASTCPVPVTVVVAADACSDATADVARAGGALVVETAAARVGTARASAVSAGLAAAGGDPRRVWIANTDADSLVPPDWLTVHLDFAARGVALLRGSVRPDRRELAAEHLRRWLALNPPEEAHPHVHGANLGLTAAAYRAAGGFCDVPLQEDVRLVRAVEAAGGATASTARAPVTTSARSVGRLEGGFATYLRDQVLQPAAEPLRGRRARTGAPDPSL
ncbi:glycosyltransferase [Amnibacterium kyonggiense]